MRFSPRLRARSLLERRYPLYRIISRRTCCASFWLSSCTSLSLSCNCSSVSSEIRALRTFAISSAPSSPTTRILTYFPSFFFRLRSTTSSWARWSPFSCPHTSAWSYHTASSTGWYSSYKEGLRFAKRQHFSLSCLKFHGSPANRMRIASSGAFARRCSLTVMNSPPAGVGASLPVSLVGWLGIPRAPVSSNTWPIDLDIASRKSSSSCGVISIRSKGPLFFAISCS
mmetsp:Transcript_49094/g.121894  ORF Transcript_49094/g.121894 Transcript_49094/m.121894 type:complete len:227 (+) Transcript_49094:91-771(+)